MSKINVRSPYYITTGTVTNLTNTQLELFIYSGTQTTDRPTTATYVINSFAINNVSTFEVAELVRDYFINTFDGDYATSIFWVDYRTTRFIQGTAEPVSGFTQLKAFLVMVYLRMAQTLQIAKRSCNQILT